MLYLVKRQSPRIKEITWDEIISGKEFAKFQWYPNNKPTGTITRWVDVRQCPPFDVVYTLKLFQQFCEKHENLFKQNRKSLYYQFNIPKSSGGQRQISAPVPELKAALNELKYLLEEKCGVLYHTSAFAYVKGRCIKDLDLKHALNKSNWFLKLDFKDFFPSINFDFLMKIIYKLYPFGFMEPVRSDQIDYVRKALSLAMLDDGLPQGSPLSPLLSNLVMIPFDYVIFNNCCDHHMVYTRYADDITISAEKKFDYRTVIRQVQEIIDEMEWPLKINKDKTRFVNSSGKNWMLGLMVNKDHRVTVGHKRKKQMKAALCNFLLDTLHGQRWSTEEAMELRGKYSYYHMVEGGYFDYVVKKLNTKYQANVLELLSKTLAGTI